MQRHLLAEQLQEYQLQNRLKWATALESMRQLRSGMKIFLPSMSSEQPVVGKRAGAYAHHLTYAIAWLRMFRGKDASPLYRQQSGVGRHVSTFTKKAVPGARATLGASLCRLAERIREPVM